MKETREVTVWYDNDSVIHYCNKKFFIVGPVDLGSLGFVVDSEKLYQEKVEAEAKVTKEIPWKMGAKYTVTLEKKKKKILENIFWSLNWIQVRKWLPAGNLWSQWKTFFFWLNL